MNREDYAIFYYKPCACGCGQLIEPVNRWGYVRRYNHGHNRTGIKTPNLGGVDNPNWKGKNYRKIWEKVHDACLLWWADVHHIDKNRKNNEWWNLKAMMKAQHTIIHMIGNTYGSKDMDGRACLDCLATWTVISNKGMPRWFTFYHGYLCHMCHQIRYRLRRQ